MKGLSVLIVALVMVCASACQQDQKVAESDEAFKTGEKYYFGEGVKQDYQEALKWFRKAAEQDDAKAQIMIGLMYSMGHGVPKDLNEATKWLRKAADQGDEMAKLMLLNFQ